MAGKSAQGVIITMNPNAEDPDTPTVIGNITNFSGPTGSATMLDATSLDSTAKEKLRGLPDSGQFSADFNFDPASTDHKAVFEAWATGTLEEFEVDYGGASMTFSGYLSNFETKGGVDAVLGGSFTIEITGAVTLA